MRTLKQYAKMAVPVSRFRADGQRNELENKINRLTTKLVDLELRFWELQGHVQRLNATLPTQGTAAQMCSEAQPTGSLAPNDPHYSLDRCFAKLSNLAPAAYAQWHRLLSVNAEAYHELPIDNCSVAGHAYAEIFRNFLRPFLTGTVLDIGCGPQPVPSYLDGYPVERIAGLDPLPPAQTHPFVFVQGTAEFLPWADGTFDTVVASTSLDHVLLIDKAFAEIHRVLKPQGHFVTWVSFLPGSPRYDPYAPKIEPVDRYHLFHFDRPWFMEMMLKQFLPVILIDADWASNFCTFRPIRQSTGDQST